MKVISFITDGVGNAMGADTVTGLLYWIPERNVRILALKQATGVAAVNDADWELVVGRMHTGQAFNHVELLPANDGGIKLGPSGITVGSGKVVQFAYVQVAPQINTVSIFYDEF